MLLFKNITIGQNLIRNGSFENYNSPVNWNNWGGGFFDTSAFPFQRVLLDWEQYQSPDCFISACTHTYSGVPINVFGNNYAKHGNNYAGFILFQKSGDTKEYISQQLSVPLQAGEIYCMSFYISRADRITHAIYSIGAYFSNTAPSMTSNVYLSAAPQIENQNGFITDTTQWLQIQGCFTAVGGEQFVTIGNFNSNAATDTLFVGSNNQLSGANGYAYYYIDDILLYDQSTVGIDQLENSNDITIYPNPAKYVLNIDLSSVKENTQINIYNSLGEIVLSESLANQHSTIKTHHLPCGVYFYRVLVGEKIMKSDKVVIMK